MATGNFKSMSDFPLIVAKDEYVKVCPECGLSCDNDAEKCENCGCDLSCVESIYDDCLMNERVNDMEKVAERLNDMQSFYKVSVESGYYSGLQFYVEDNYYDVENWDNEDAQNEFGVCRSEVLRRYKVAGNTIRRELRKARKELCLIELCVRARFSNGETIYSQVA